jgi:pimeloyl-ACP methyl ester carboxylesterase
VTFILLAFGAFAMWLNAARGPQEEALPAMQPDTQLDVKTGRWIVFRPKAKEPAVGLIIYPGARVDARSYSPSARAIAARGYMVIIVPMPLNMAAFGINRATEVIEAFPGIERWAICGHSVGGAMAASFVSKNPSAVEGLVLLSSYPAAGSDLSARSLKVTSIYETLDGSPVNKKIDTHRPFLPPHTCWVPIEGGSHAQFAWYGLQKKENIPTITHETVHEKTVAATLDLLDKLNEVKRL